MNLGQHILIFLVRVYRCTLSPAKTFVFGPLGGCRFTPSCSAYALEALRTHGALRGSWLAVKRICRCHPWTECGHDPVPAKDLGEQAGNNLNDDRPHPGPLPQERGTTLHVLGDSDNCSTNPAHGSRKRLDTILPLLGERAGVRAVVNTSNSSASKAC